jgi:membrane associated rhomboid family serine protease
VPPQQEPIFNIPTPVLLLVASFVLIHTLRLLLPDETDLDVLLQFAFVPARFSHDMGLLTPEELVRRAAEGLGEAQGERGLAVLHAFALVGNERPWTVLTYAFLHADFTHITLNGLWCVIFGRVVSLRFGAVRFILFFFTCVVAAALAQWAYDIAAAAPVIGASGGIAGLMGGALRFMFRDTAILGPRADVHIHAPALSLAEMARSRRAVAFALILVITNIIFAVGIDLMSGDGQAIAWQAHLGGLFAGVLVFPLFDPVGREEPPPLA